MWGYICIAYLSWLTGYIMGDCKTFEKVYALAMKTYWSLTAPNYTKYSDEMWQAAVMLECHPSDLILVDGEWIIKSW